MIYCPRCGRLASSTQKFCTGCGLHLLVVLQALASQAATEELEALERRVRTLRRGVQQMFSGLGLAFFFYFFFGHSIGFASIGLMMFFIGLGQVLNAMLFASPALRIEWRIPSLPREGERHSMSAPRPEEGATVRARDLPESRPSVTESPTLPLDPSQRFANGDMVRR
ncbi:MAG: zinc ribbon domain-containing protein [Blastocatellia bacterium]|nr:zinc ribbon domain-containing protein [Blastocatellia bacterium]MCS7156295.1 zinc ribbon domain-containing protein [Blastocatellia bacterium]MCX7751355.1 zinc ribbon domain-containing protein [Blastocatellia bacterium]MDW8169067.1 DUF6249 domain-containing protein [Acidobacteriota bacterium]MDW8256427.1 DUF6249 domain-containing protein [Acidobacteriota bacterium]